MPLDRADIKIPDNMGVWDDYNECIWLPHEHYPARHQAIRFAMDQWHVGFTEVRCRVRWMKYTPERIVYPDGSEYHEDLWRECSQDEPGAFRVWRLEDAA